ncbi:metal-dependent hydrolase [Streptomyces cupreus]|uniref:Metal-dependent hydrolase n=1 Tax=Streptomyces cupreus TaxID=2759956 RepID=A0A7X1MBD1_9ACTN|nr:metal-dependent hydrolase [Streptomyces cupreus]MBC2904716.1 metal-dependent hydrolase [Streptomyces cupreus]
MVHSSETLQGAVQVATYLDDTYLDQADTRVIAVGERDGAPWAAVEHCLFHPQGGGQPAGRGWLEGAEVVPVRARIDVQARMTHAALHTAGHLVEAVGRLQGWEMLSNNHFPGQARIEFQAPQPDARLADPEGREEATTALRDAVAAAIADDLPVFARYEGEGRRVVHLDALHSAPCRGTHVRSLGALAGVILPTLKVKKGRIRVSCSATHRSH